ncbi:alanyl-tRNA synthetase [Inquilinus ginsengisoli]|uniref:Alanine--tRNA ligase n=1 Tax=Inquilinus ginsengisoli TaxID=363840 RepID=A0ABU1JPI6_9PROT|nr:alanine--tRNA ligase-related protein [Inquilinus ginsengisoli]MDR6290529.1 alanyl-tRNA synthetase [Inquilinus ginsengisoli]
MSAQEVAYVPAGRLTHRFQLFCEEKGIGFTTNPSVRPFDSTTLFCTAGMQQFKPLFADPAFTGTFANLQPCLRLGDLDEIGDGTHRLRFDMIGLFSFRRMTVGQAIDFWLAFLDGIGAWPDHVTIHPDRMDAWSPLYRGRVPIRPDPDCTWSDGAISGCCTEFYRDGVEIGNIVNPLGSCIDCGFGLDRLDMLVNGTPPPTPEQVLVDAIESIIASGYRPGGKAQGYVLRKLLRRLWALGGTLDHPEFRAEVARQQRLRSRYLRLKTRHPDQPPEWWFDTHGIDLAELEDAP